MSTGRPYRAQEGHLDPAYQRQLARRDPRAAPGEGGSSPDTCAPASPAVSLPPRAGVDHVHLLDSQGSLSQPREGLRDGSSSGRRGVGGTEDREISRLLSRTFWARLGFPKGKPQGGAGAPGGLVLGLGVHA